MSSIEDIIAELNAAHMGLLRLLRFALSSAAIHPEFSDNSQATIAAILSIIKMAGVGDPLLVASVLNQVLEDVKRHAGARRRFKRVDSRLLINDQVIAFFNAVRHLQREMR